VTGEAAVFVGGIPDHYDRCLGPVLFADFADDLATRVAASDPRRVPELAAGTGIVTRRLRDLLPSEALLTATDLNPPMLDVAQTKFHVGERIEFQPADATALPFPDGVFDAVVCQFGVMFFPDKDRSYREVHRVLGRGGRYAFSVWDGYQRFGKIADDVTSRYFPTDPPQFYRVPSSYHRLDPVKDSLSAAGFTDLRVSVLNREKTIADIGLFARGLVYGNPLIDMIRVRGGVDPRQFVDTLARALRQEFGDPGRISLQAIVFEASRR